MIRMHRLDGLVRSDPGGRRTDSSKMGVVRHVFLSHLELSRSVRSIQSAIVNPIGRHQRLIVLAK